MRKRKIVKVTNAMKKLLKSGRGVNKYLTCKECDEVEVEVGPDIKNVTCAYCVQRVIGPPPNYEKKEKSDKPRGWHFKAYYEHNGVVYSKGIEITDPAEISRLKKEAGVTKLPESKKKKIKKVKSVKTSVKVKTKKRGKKNARATR